MNYTRARILHSQAPERLVVGLYLATNASVAVATSVRLGDAVERLESQGACACGSCAFFAALTTTQAACERETNSVLLTLAGQLLRAQRAGAAS